MKYIIKNCLNCNKEFESYEKHNRKFCNRKCSAQSNKNILHSVKPKTGQYKKCLTCGNEIYVQKWQSRNKKFCSRKCMSNHPDKIKRALKALKNIDNKGKNNPRYVNGKWIYRQIALADMEQKCYVCDEQRKNKIIVHHIDGDRDNNKLNNLLPICRSCHLVLHRLSEKTVEQRKYLNKLVSKLNKTDNRGALQQIIEDGFQIYYVKPPKFKGKISEITTS